MNELRRKIEEVRELEGKRRNHELNMYSRASHRERLGAVVGLLSKYVQNVNFLDVGCAEGLYCGIAKTFGARRVVGIDVSESKLERARKTYLCEFYKANAEESLEKFYNSFNFILCSELLQHVTDYKKTMSEIVKCLDGFGLILVTTSNLSRHRGFSMGFPILKHEYTDVEGLTDVETLMKEIGGAGLSKNSIWRFNTVLLERELVELFPLKRKERIPIATPDKKLKELFTILLFCSRYPNKN